MEEGDIYRALGGNLILNLNAYRGLQVIDFSDVSNPEIIGRLRVTGTPVEMYVVDNRVYILMNNWQGYYGTRSDVRVDSYQGGMVVAVDIADPHNPVMTAQAQVPGWIQTSRLTRGGGKEALYVAASDWNDGYTAIVRSFAVNAGGLVEPRSAIDLGGYVRDIQASPEALLVARYDWEQYDGRSTVAVIDISDPDGFMVEGAEILTEGLVNHKSNMNLYRGILRIVSSASWSGSNTNHVETFDVADLLHPIRVNHKTFGDNEDLYATIFLDNRAFFVTYRRVDPFHAFYIGDDGFVREMNEFIISGWNDFFKPVLGQTRLIGIGVDDQEGWSMAVSLYDITDLANPDPFVARAPVSAGHSWSEARWDDRAFSVLDNAVSVTNPDGSVETGLVLLPFSGYNDDWDRYTAGVQIFTFSESSLTQRGVMDHGTWVRRSFMAEEVTANLSEAELSLFDSSDPDNPVELGRTDLAPNYVDYFVFGEYGARLKYDRDYYWWWGYSQDLPANELQIVPVGQDPDTAEPVATIPVPAGAQVFQVGSLAVATETRYVDTVDDEPRYETTIEVFDLSDPVHPVKAGSLVTDQIMPYYYWYGWGMEDCWDCWYPYYYYGSTTAYAVGDSLVFPTTIWEQELEGVEHACYTYPADRYYRDECLVDDQGNEQCFSYSGSISCRHLNNEPEVCSGSIMRCTYDNEDIWRCEEIDPDSIETQTHCYDWDRYRYWSHFDLHVLDLREPAQPAVGPVISMPSEEEAVGLLAEGSDLFVSYRVPVDVDGDSRSYVRYYFKKIGLDDPADPDIGEGINVPGQLLQVDGSQVYTRDFVWGENVVESALNKLQVAGSQAVLLARKRFADQDVHTMLLDGRGHALVTHRLAWYVADQDGQNWEDILENLTVLDVAENHFEMLSRFEVDRWAGLRDAKDGRALFSVPGGLLVVNLDNPRAPHAQAYFPVLGWPLNLRVHDDQITFAAGRYGMYRFHLDTYNLTSPM